MKHDFIINISYPFSDNANVHKFYRRAKQEQKFSQLTLNHIKRMTGISDFFPCFAWRSRRSFRFYSNYLKINPYSPFSRPDFKRFFPPKNFEFHFCFPACSRYFLHRCIRHFFLRQKIIKMNCSVFLYDF